MTVYSDKIVKCVCTNINVEKKEILHILDLELQMESFLSYLNYLLVIL